MKSYHEETLAALFDGEAAEPDALADALAQPEAARFLVELSRLRALTQDDDRRPDDRFYAETRKLFRPRRWKALLHLPVPLPLAAAAVAGAVAITVAVPLLGPVAPLPVGHPPAAPRLAVARELPAPPLRGPEVIARPPLRRPPAANRVMQFVDGRDWRQGS